jgi:hypothetical protein
MERTIISIPDELLQRLRVMAAERRTSIAALVREALEEKARSTVHVRTTWESGPPVTQIPLVGRLRSVQSHALGVEPSSEAVEPVLHRGFSRSAAVPDAAQCPA